MAKITSYTKPYIDALERRVIVGGRVSADGNLKLVNGLGDEIDAGNVQGDLPDRLLDIEEELNSEEFKRTQVPKKSTMLTELQNEAFYSTSGPMSKVIIGWLAPTKDIYDQPIVVKDYQVYVDGAPAYRVIEPRVEFELRTDQDVDIYVLAGTMYGVWSDPSDTVNVTGAKPLYEAATPTAPVLTCSLGVVAARWDGQYVEGVSVANSYVVVHAKVNDGTPFIAGTLMTDQPMLIPNTVSEDLVEVWFVGFDKLGRETGTSISKTIDVTGIDLPDLSDAVNDFLNNIAQTATNAQTTANSAANTANTAATDAAAAATNAAAAAGIAGGKGEVIFLNTEPPVEKQLPQNLWIDTAGGLNTPKRWDGSDWVPVTDKVAVDAAAEAVAAKDRADNAFNAATNAATVAGQAQLSADGKSRIWYLATPPPGVAHKKDDVWFDTANDMRMSYWNVTTSAWVLAQFGTDAIANLSITNALIANATIDNAKISNVDAGKVTTGFLSADRINVNSLEGKHMKSNTISTNKMLITSFENLLQDYSFEYNTTDAWQYISPTVNDAVNSRSGARSLKVVTTATAYVVARQAVSISVADGERYLLNGWVRLDTGVSGGNGITLRIGWSTTEGGATTASADVALTPTGTSTTYVQISGEWTVPATARFATLEIISRDVTPGRVYRVDDLELFKKTTGELIVDGSISGSKITVDEAFAVKVTADTVMAGKIKTSFIVDDGSGINLLSSNGPITFTADSYTATQTALTDVSGSVDTLSGDLSTVQELAQENDLLLKDPDNGIVKKLTDTATLVGDDESGLVKGTNDLKAAVGDSASGLVKKTDDLDRELTAQKISFVVTPTAIEIRPKTGDNYIRMTSEGIYIIQGTSIPSYWEANVFYVSGDLRSKTLVLEEHTIKRYAAGRTIITENG